MNSNYRVAATLYYLETWFVSENISVNTLHKEMMMMMMMMMIIIIIIIIIV
jgi:hypothetical protein